MSLFYAYRAATRLLGPALYFYLNQRKNRGKEDAGRIGERFGHPSAVRPKGKLVWLHGASVGESLAALPVIDEIRRLYPGASILVTTGTVTSAAMMHDRLPDGVIHQFVPIDRQVCVARFLHHWKPDIALWLESDFWPNILTRAHKSGTKIVLVNGRISAKSFKGYSRFSSFIRPVLKAFDLILTQSGDETERFSKLGADNVLTVGNLKFAARPLPADPDKLSHLRDQIGSRPVWLASSTFDGEESIVGDIHKNLRDAHTGLLSIIVPRHPNRADDIETELVGNGLVVARRSKNDPITDTTDVYLADTIGELGLFYRVSPFCFMGKSLCAVGGQNPLEPARLECGVLHGPDMSNFKTISSEMLKDGACRVVTDAKDLERQVNALLHNPQTAKTLGTKGLAYANSKAEVLARTMDAIAPLMAAKAIDRGPDA
ncbi:3-deoxy-D-manno-octulosonic acid transferase [Thalassospira sp. MA62]|nr:3-deoxy-D-manno-octulosonic acid transferase [Thalassospira sp. MA62]